jgi:hypothetical protein
MRQRRRIVVKMEPTLQQRLQTMSLEEVKKKLNTWTAALKEDVQGFPDVGQVEEVMRTHLATALDECVSIYDLITTPKPVKRGEVEETEAERVARIENLTELFREAAEVARKRYDYWSRTWVV